MDVNVSSSSRALAAPKSVSMYTDLQVRWEKEEWRILNKHFRERGLILHATKNKNFTLNREKTLEHAIVLEE